LFNSSVWKDRSIFTLQNVKYFVLNVPGTYPAWKINGEMIAGMMSPSLSCYPPELTFFLNKNWIISGKSIQKIFKAFSIKKNLFIRKLTDPYDLFVYVIRLPDSLSHRAKANRNLLTKYMKIAYKKIDDLIGQILKDPAVENLIIISDHGLKYYEQGFCIKRWLEKKNLLFLNENKEEKLNNLFQNYYRMVKPYFKNFPFKKYIRKNFKPKEKTQEIIKRKSTKIINKTRVQRLVGNVGGLFLSEKDKIKKEKIQEALKKDKDIVDSIKNELRGFPDFFIILKEKYVFITKPSFSVKIKRFNKINHAKSGLFIAYGRNVIEGYNEQVDYVNIAPTILRLLNIEQPIHMSGKALNIIKKKKKNR
jgi:predicted AlkP superfamily phosphohydrolase/phosphomutase